MFSSFIFIFGLLIGSFLNVCIFRIPKGESISYPPSHCVGCNNRIKWYDLIPVLSYMALRGKCRHCGEKISLRYPIIELITGVLFLAVYINFGFDFHTFQYIAFIIFLIVIGIIDFDTTDVYENTIIAGMVCGLVFIGIEYFIFTHSLSNTLNYLYGAMLGGGVITIIILLTHGMGWGDVEICALGGIFLGFKLTVVMLFFSFIIGGAVGLVLLIFKIKSRKDQMPFGPFIALAAVVTIFFGNNLMNWYLSLMHI